MSTIPQKRSEEPIRLSGRLTYKPTFDQPSGVNLHVRRELGVGLQYAILSVYAQSPRQVGAADSIPLEIWWVVHGHHADQSKTAHRFMVWSSSTERQDKARIGCESPGQVQISHGRVMVVNYSLMIIEQPERNSSATVSLSKMKIDHSWFGQIEHGKTTGTVINKLRIERHCLIRTWVSMIGQQADESSEWGRKGEG
ncbi:hypothetical protein CROQUDRAFT_94873 [Cronartium quercuum f. sp. fusiforme G11]|uniref:Uncharacterized protein n=1 Tax=Cronartium quercuum f. sp. fusiforme G11 TaxID=708437 RepID=A0A9P6NEJ9_9BASI|nr:hypothetical protein CROQUDRAFT_94873 [Cronartium quercuum f. sp. fusiforme G11]